MFQWSCGLAYLFIAPHNRPQSPPPKPVLSIMHLSELELLLHLHKHLMFVFIANYQLLPPQP